MQTTLKFDSHQVLPTSTGTTKAPVPTMLKVDTNEAYSLELVFAPDDEQKVTWWSSVYVLADAFEGIIHLESDIIFCVDTTKQEIHLMLSSPHGEALIELPYLPLLHLMDQLQASGLTPWQLPEATETEIALLLQGSE